MKRFLLLVLLLALTAPAFGQGVRYNGTVTNQQGMPVPAATVYICTLTSTGTPCSPTVLIYSDVALTQPISNPITTDNYGRYGFWITPGNYLQQISGFGIITSTQPITVGGGSGGLSDPGSNGIVKRTALNTTAIAVPTDYPTLNQDTTGTAAHANGLSSYPALCVGSQFSQGLSSGSNNCATPGGGGGGGVNHGSLVVSPVGTVFGDSIGAGYMSGSPTSCASGCLNQGNKSFAALLTPVTGITWNNLAVQTQEVPDLATQAVGCLQIGFCSIASTFSPATITSSSVSLFQIGVNDLHFQGGSSLQLATFGGQYLALEALRAIPSSNLIYAQASSATCIGGFAPDSHYGGSTEKASTTNGASCTFTTGASRVLYILTTISDDLTGRSSVTVDGVSQGTIATTAPYVISSQYGVTFSPWATRIGGLTYAPHTVVLTCTAQPCYVLGLGWLDGSQRNVGPLVIANGVTRSTENTDSDTANYNAQIQSATTALAGDGLQVQYVDLSSVVPGTYMVQDGVHPADIGHSYIAQLDATIINGLIAPFPKLNVATLGTSPLNNHTNAYVTMDASLGKNWVVYPVGGSNLETVSVTNADAAGSGQYNFTICQDATGTSTGAGFASFPFSSGWTIGTTALDGSAASFMYQSGVFTFIAGSSNITGSCPQVVWELDGDTLGSGGSSISSWTDSIGGNNAVQATGADKPAVATPAGFNSHKVASFNGTTDFLATGSAIANSARAASFAVFIVHEPTSASTLEMPLTMGSAFGGTAGELFFQLHNAALSWQDGFCLNTGIQEQCGGSLGISSTLPSTTAANLDVVIYNGTDLIFRHDGVETWRLPWQGLKNTQSTVATVGAYTGPLYEYGGYIAHIEYWSPAPTLAQTQAEEAVLGTKYGYASW